MKWSFLQGLAKRGSRLGRGATHPVRCTRPVPFRPIVDILEDRIVPSTCRWINASGGDWANPANWSCGMVPGPSDDVIIDYTGTNPVTHKTGSDTIQSLENHVNLHIQMGSSLTITGNFMDIGDHGPRTLAVGNDQVTGAMFTATGTSTIIGMSLTASSRGTLDLPVVNRWIGAGGDGSAAAINVQATSGATMDLGVAQISVGNTYFLAQGTGSQINLPNLTSFIGARNDFSLLEADNGGIIIADNLTRLITVTLKMTGPATLPTGGVSTFFNGNVFLQSGASLSLPQLTRFDGTGNRNLTFQANNGTLDLSSVHNWQGAGSANVAAEIIVQALNGGVVNLPGVTQIHVGNTEFLAQGASSQINLPNLTSLIGARNDASGLQAGSGGTIAASKLVSLDGVSLALTGNTSQLPTGQISTFRNGNLTADQGATLQLPLVISIAGPAYASLIFKATNGGTLDLSPVTQWQGAGSAGSAAAIGVQASIGGTVNLAVAQISVGNTGFLAQGTGSQINLPNLTSFVGARNDVSLLQADSGGLIRAGNLTSLNTVTAQADSGGILAAPHLASLIAGQLVLSGASSQISTDQISTFRNGNLTADQGATLRLPLVTSIVGPANTNLSFRATNSGTLDLSAVNIWQGAGVSSTIFVQALSGGTVNLSGVAQITVGNTEFKAQGTNSQGASSQINLATLQDFAGVSASYSSLEADSGGAIMSGWLQHLNHISLTFEGTGTIGVDELESATNGRISVLDHATISFLKNVSPLKDVDGSGFEVRNGGQLTIGSVMNYDPALDDGIPPPGFDNSALADGPDSQLVCDFINARYMPGHRPGGIVVLPTHGAKIQFPCLKRIQTNFCFEATDAGSTIDLPVLREFISDDSSHSCFVAESGGVIDVDNAEVLNGQPGKATLTNVHITLAVVNSVPGQLLVKKLELGPGSVLDGNGTLTGSLNLKGGTVNVGQAGTSLTVTSNVKFSAGTITGPGNLIVTGLFTWQGGTMSGTGQTNANGGLVLRGPNLKALDNRVFNNTGVGSWTGGDLNMGHGAIFNNSDSLDVQSNPFILNTFGGAASFINRGTLTLEAGITFTIVGDLTNLGTLTLGPGSTLYVSGNYTQGSMAIMDIQLGGTDPSQYGRLKVGGTASLAGTLQVTFVNGYVPTSGDACQILMFGSRGGTDFDNYPDGFALNYDDTNGTLTIVVQ